MARWRSWRGAKAVSIWLLLMASTTKATTIGAGSGIVLANPPMALPFTFASLEVHRIPVSLSAGTYSVGSFSFHNATQSATPSAPGSVVPFLALLTNAGEDLVGPSRSYQTIWVGAAVAVSNVETLNDPANIVNHSYSLTVEQFSLPANADIFAGLYTIGTGRVAHRAHLPETPAARIDHDNSFTPPIAAGQSLTSFSNVFFNGIVAFQIDVQLASVPPAVPGDFNSDQKVDGEDFGIWQLNFPGSSGKSLATGDADGDGDVDGADFVVWQTHFSTTSSSMASAVPEPISAGLALIGAVAVLRQFGQRWV
jgi:hypothetical protein